MSKFKKFISRSIPFLILLLLIFLVYWIVSKVWFALHSADAKLAIALVTAATTIIVSTLTVVIGRYYERKKDIEAHFREKKLTIYDDFLKEFFDIMDLSEGQKESKDLVPFLREWQRKMILWGGQEVLTKYIEWKSKLGLGEPDVKTMWLTEEFFRAIRKDLGHSSPRSKKWTFVYLMLRNAELFVALSKDNPNMTLTQFGEFEKLLEESAKE